jgi:hypothetical protein
LEPAPARKNGLMSMGEPGLDRHEWETEYETLEPELADAPGEALPQLADLVERILEARGFQLDEPTTVEGDERDVVFEYLAGRAVSDRVERGEDVDPGDVGAAVVGLQGVYAFFLVERAAP